ncbi:uncharacterized protein BT62DRAFT_798481 [Guyanagaster necrorhizus]|uniref:Heterokaryon incompatibility domain-containing protein n=1 Tax=Guyanagaster necrorhizus TaxID=856835 RepID=A0A9P7VEL7_9AGAR|nr:uncharacterized protein BT62DRAFT_798481 [Guyanagaster necrorhizus MCA 3950]KAG7439148.1 hypothetical protein BT62DRAFT_798481 [Guyanagaster necrorhizus MCA 3950]
MGNIPSRIIALLFSRVNRIWNRLCSAFSTAQAMTDPSDSDQNANIIPESQGAIPNGSSTAEGDGPVLEVTTHSPPDLSSAETAPEPLSWDSYSVFPESQAPEDLTFPVVTISAFTETGQQESSIKVPSQRSYTGRKPVISSSLADTPCATLGVMGLLDQLNTTLRTSHTLDTRSMSSTLEDCIKNNYDFGTAYGRLRMVWGIKDWNAIPDGLRTREARDQERRRDALVGNRIVQPNLEPRRVWDLCANRVVPWWSNNAFLYPMPWLSAAWTVRPVSHAWMDAKDRVNVWTPINGKEWPVPIPNDTNLDLIRIEMLNLGEQYVWLDVLCLRQEGGLREDLRAEEWKVDVPTIGRVYRDAEVATYLSGLGRPFTLNDGDLDSDCCWFRRAWTLQEVGRKRIIVGDTPDGPLHAKPIDKDGNYDTEILTRFHKQLRSISAVNHLSPRLPVSPTIFEALSQMQNRVSTNPVDKVAGLAFPLLPTTIPVYQESESLEDAWTELVNAMDVENRGRLFISYPEPGDTGMKWRPSWEQVMKNPLPVNDCPFMTIDWKTNDSWYKGPCIEKVFVRGLAPGGAAEVERRGELIIKNANLTEHTFDIIARHKFPIPEDIYTLLGMDGFDLRLVPKRYWVVGRRLSDEKFEKVSVFEIVYEEAQRMELLGITKRCRNILI